MRVIPVMNEIAVHQKSLSYDEVLKYLDQKFYALDDVNHEHPLEPLYSVADCACRTSKKLVGQGCNHPIEGMCIQIGPEAEYYIRTGRGRQVTREEVLATLDKAEKSGLVHEVFEFGFSDRPVGESQFICNCCSCGCGVCTVQCKFDAIHLKWDREHEPTGNIKEWKSEMIKNVVKRSFRVAANETLKLVNIDPVSRAKKKRG